MPLPELIEIVPLTGPVQARVSIPGSKSLTNRALVLAALARGRVTLRGALWSEDTQVMVVALRRLGFSITVSSDADQAANRTLVVRGLGGRIPRAGTPQRPLELFVGNAGTAARFLGALVCLGGGAYRLYGEPRMHERPQAALFQALRELGHRVDSPNGRLPAVIHGTSPRTRTGAPRTCTVSITESSQFASALLLCARVGGWRVRVVGENAEESPYVTLTRKLLAAFPHRGGEFTIEPDASSASYFWAVNALIACGSRAGRRFLSRSFTHWPIQVANWPRSRWQIDDRFPTVLRAMFGAPDRAGSGLSVSRATDLGDAIMTAIVLAPLAPTPCRFTDLGRLRVQECERVAALRTELTRCGATVREAGDSLHIVPSPLHGARIQTYNDHRVAMCFATLGLKVPGVQIHNPACVNKTFPNFFQILAAPPAAGLGTTIRDVRTGRALSGDDLLPR